MSGAALDCMAADVCRSVTTLEESNRFLCPRSRLYRKKPFYGRPKYDLRIGGRYGGPSRRGCCGVVVVLLYKLAVQDPLSLLRATCALASFYRAGEETPSIWKEAFYGSDSKHEPEACSGLDAAIEDLGGYKTFTDPVQWLLVDESKNNPDKTCEETTGRAALSLARAAPHI